MGEMADELRGSALPTRSSSHRADTTAAPLRAGSGLPEGVTEPASQRVGSVGIQDVIFE